MSAELDNGWPEYQRLVLSELARMSSAVESTTRELVRLQVRLAHLETELKFKSGLWGALAGAFVALPALIYALFKLAHNQ